MRVSPVSALTVAVLPSTIVAVPRSVRTLAFFRRTPTPLVRRVTIESFQAIVRAKSSFGGPIESPMAFERAGLAQAMRCAGGVDQRLRGNAADVEARSAEPVGFDEDRVEAELAGADRGDIAARAAADDENLAAKLVHVVVAGSVRCHPRESGGPGAVSGESVARGAGAARYPLPRV